MAIKVGDRVWIVANCPIICVCKKCKNSHVSGYEWAIYEKSGHVVEVIEDGLAKLQDHAKWRSIKNLASSPEEAQKMIEARQAEDATSKD